MTESNRGFVQQGDSRWGAQFPNTSQSNDNTREFDSTQDLVVFLRTKRGEKVSNLVYYPWNDIGTEDPNYKPPTDNEKQTLESLGFKDNMEHGVFVRPDAAPTAGVLAQHILDKLNEGDYDEIASYARDLAELVIEEEEN